MEYKNKNKKTRRTKLLRKIKTNWKVFAGIFIDCILEILDANLGKMIVGAMGGAIGSPFIGKSYMVTVIGTAVATIIACATIRMIRKTKEIYEEEKKESMQFRKSILAK